jgi:hypothetical protein
MVKHKGREGYLAMLKISFVSLVVKKEFGDSHA